MTHFTTPGSQAAELLQNMQTILAAQSKFMVPACGPVCALQSYQQHSTPVIHMWFQPVPVALAVVNSIGLIWFKMAQEVHGLHSMYE